MDMVSYATSPSAALLQVISMKATTRMTILTTLVTCLVVPTVAPGAAAQGMCATLWVPPQLRDVCIAQPTPPPPAAPPLPGVGALGGDAVKNATGFSTYVCATAGPVVGSWRDTISTVVATVPIDSTGSGEGQVTYERTLQGPKAIEGTVRGSSALASIEITYVATQDHIVAYTFAGTEILGAVGRATHNCQGDGTISPNQIMEGFVIWASGDLIAGRVSSRGTLGSIL